MAFLKVHNTTEVLNFPADLWMQTWLKNCARHIWHLKVQWKYVQNYSSPELTKVIRMIFAVCNAHTDKCCSNLARSSLTQEDICRELTVEQLLKYKKNNFLKVLNLSYLIYEPTNPMNTQSNLEVHSIFEEVHGNYTN